jgi:hypothetical protein
MREIQKDVEQLGEACRQISKKTPTGARLALLLTDNLVELLMYKHGRLPNTLTKRNEKRNFKDKVDFLRSETYLKTKQRC